MFNLFRKKDKKTVFNFQAKGDMPSKSDIRDTLFGDMPLSEWCKNTDEEPWRSFFNAKNSIESGDKEAAKQILEGIINQSDYESRHYLQAWHYLRELGVNPDTPNAKHIYGVVVEVALQKGLDIVSVYEDYSARYFNFCGKFIIWETPDGSLNDVIDRLLTSGRVVAENIGPWDGARPPKPPLGQARISMLTPSGIHFGQASLDDLSRDSMGGPVIRHAFELMQNLIAKI